MPYLDICPACGSKHWAWKAELTAESRKKFEDYMSRKYGDLFAGWADEHAVAVAGCSSCGHKWHVEVPDEDTLSKMYEVARPLRPGGNGVPPPTAGMIARMRALKRVAGDTVSLLDFGAGGCRWSAAAALAGFDVTAFEPNDNRVAKHDVPFETIEDPSALDGRTFDVIHLEQVLEHLPDPLAVLRALRPKLSSTGILVARVPNLLMEERLTDVWGTWPFDGERTHAMAPFEHIQGFTPHSLEVLAQRAGYKLVAVSRLIRHMPRYVVRRLAGRMNSALGQTQIVCCG